MNDLSPYPTRRGARRARRLAQLETALRDCARLLEVARLDCPEAQSIEKRIARARHEVERLKSLEDVSLASVAEERDLLGQLAQWSDAIRDLAETLQSWD